MLTSYYKDLLWFCNDLSNPLRIWAFTFIILIAIILYCDKREWNELDFISFRHNHKTLWSCLSCSRQVLYSELCLWIKLHHEVSLRFHPWSSSYAKYGLSKWMSFSYLRKTLMFFLTWYQIFVCPNQIIESFFWPYSKYLYI